MPLKQRNQTKPDHNHHALYSPQEHQIENERKQNNRPIKINKYIKIIEKYLDISRGYLSENVAKKNTKPNTVGWERGSTMNCERD